MLASVAIRSKFLDKIKARKFKNLKLNKIWKKVVSGEVQYSTLDACGVSRVREYICMPCVGVAIPSLLGKAHSSK